MAVRLECRNAPSDKANLSGPSSTDSTSNERGELFLLHKHKLERKWCTLTTSNTTWRLAVLPLMGFALHSIYQAGVMLCAEWPIFVRYWALLAVFGLGPTSSMLVVIRRYQSSNASISALGWQRRVRYFMAPTSDHRNVWPDVCICLSAILLLLLRLATLLDTYLDDILLVGLCVSSMIGVRRRRDSGAAMKISMLRELHLLVAALVTLLGTLTRCFPWLSSLLLPSKIATGLQADNNVNAFWHTLLRGLFCLVACCGAIRKYHKSR